MLAFLISFLTLVLGVVLSPVAGFDVGKITSGFEKQLTDVSQLQGNPVINRNNGHKPTGNHPSIDLPNMGLVATLNNSGALTLENTGSVATVDYLVLQNSEGNNQNTEQGNNQQPLPPKTPSIQISNKVENQIYEELTLKGRVLVIVSLTDKNI